MLKKVIMFVLAVALAAGWAVNDSWAGVLRQPVIELNGNSIEAPVDLADENLLLPLRSISEAAGYKVVWSADDNTVTISKAPKVITVKPDEYKVIVNDHSINMSGAPKLITGTTYVPIDFLTDNLALQVDWDKPNNKVIITSIIENNITINTVKETSSTDKLELDIQYPQIQGLSNPEVQNKINAIFAGAALSAKEQGLESARLLDEAAISRQIKAGAYFNYIVKYNQNDLLSVVLLNYQYSGGAHGLTVQSSYTFNLNTGEEYALKDLFNEGTEYITTINQEIKKQMADRDLLSAQLTPFESINDNQDYYLTNSSIVIYFQQYEYFPYAFGLPEFAIDFPSLGELMKLDL